MIRKLEKADHLHLVQLYEIIANQIENPAYFNWSHEKVRSELLAAQTLIYDWQEQVISFITYRELPDFIEITAVGTAPLMRRKGFSQAILHELAGYAARQNKPLGLEVHQDNVPALSLYQKWGFILARTRANYYPDGRDAAVLTYKKSGPAQ
ncbi:MAG: GNAT family N-acetyltransferase [Bdellovibrionaceae bacterium]|nr:GNAT family N-acetyltransferase [Bdellovibrio sp.]